MGQFNALLVSLYSAIATVWKEIEVDLGIISWILDRGKDFAMEKIRQIGQEYIRQTRPLLVREKGVNLYDSPKEFEGYEVIHMKTMITPARPQLWFDSLRIPCDNISAYWISLRHLSDMKGPKDASRIDRWIGNNSPWKVNANFLDFLMSSKEFIPGDWPTFLAGGKNAYFCFFGTHYSRKDVDFAEFGYYIRFMRYFPDRACWVEGFLSIKELEKIWDNVVFVSYYNQKFPEYM